MVEGFEKHAKRFRTLPDGKNNYAIYLTNIYSDPKLSAWFRAQFRAAGKKLDMGKSCVRFRALADLPLPVIGKVIASTSVEKYLARYERIKKR